MTQLRPVHASSAQTVGCHRIAEKCICGVMRLVLVLVCGLLLTAVPASAAHAWAYTDIVDFNLTESTVTYGAFHISASADGSASYRWVDSPAKTTVISGNDCSDLSPLSAPRTIPAGDTNYYGLFGGKPPTFCFLLRGRTAAGQGSMTYYDGRIRR